MSILEKIKWRISHMPDLHQKLFHYKLAPFFKGKSGIEIGGPTALFHTELPIYRMVENLDGCNYSETTIWEGEIEGGRTYNYYLKKTGFQYIAEASDLKGIETGKYDF